MSNNEVQYKELLEVARSPGKAEQPPREICEQMWFPNGNNIFGKLENSRSRRLIQGREWIREHENTYNCATQLSLMFLAHDVDSLVLGLKKSRQHGRGRKTLAFEQYAKDSGLSSEEVRNEYKRSRSLFQVLAEEGPGSLLLVLRSESPGL